MIEYTSMNPSAQRMVSVRGISVSYFGKEKKKRTVAYILAFSGITARTWLP